MLIVKTDKLNYRENMQIQIGFLLIYKYIRHDLDRCQIIVEFASVDNSVLLIK